MPINPLIGAGLISGGVSLLGGAFGAAGGANLNKKTRRHQMEMLKMQQAYNDKVNQQQMDFQREVNQQNFDWNDPSNMRDRIEAAGYNPYLYNRENLGSATGSSLNSLGTALGSPPAFNPAESLASGIGGVVPSFYNALMSQKEVDGKSLDNEVSEYNFNKLKENDKLSKNGISAYYQGGLTAISQIESAQANAQIQTIQSTFAEWRKSMYERNALDQNGQPLVDENGEYVSNYEADEQANITRNVLSVEKLEQDLLAGQINLDSMEIDNLIKRYDLQYMKPQELSNLKESLAVMKSTITANNASAQASLANAYNQMMQGQTTAAMRPYQVGAASWDASNKKFGALRNKISYLEDKSDYDFNSWDRKFKSMPIFNFVHGFSNTVGAAAIPGFGRLLRFLKK